MEPESVLADAALAPGTSHASGVYTSRVVDPEPLLPNGGDGSDWSGAGAAAAEADPRESTYVRSMVWVSAIVFLQFLCQMITALTVFPDEVSTRRRTTPPKATHRTAASLC